MQWKGKSPKETNRDSTASRSHPVRHDHHRDYRSPLAREQEDPHSRLHRSPIGAIPSHLCRLSSIPGLEVIMELLIWLEQLAIWRMQREHAEPKQEPVEQSEDRELPVVLYPPVLAAS